MSFSSRLIGCLGAGTFFLRPGFFFSVASGSADGKGTAKVTTGWGDGAFIRRRSILR